ncbi:MAG: hypothetical protein STSR0008_06660 [Ignavibacterium sp.]
MRKNYNNHPIIILFFTIIFLVLMSFIPKDLKILGYQIKPIDLFIDIKPDSLLDNSNLFNKIFNKKESNQFDLSKANYTFASFIPVVTDNSKINIKDQEKNENEINSGLYEYLSNVVGISGNVSNLKYFFDALKETKTKQVRVADYGDSGNEGDLITADIRQKFQEKFGGKGVGMLSITSQDITFRTTTKHSFSDNWKTVSVLTGKEGNIPFGINGFVSIPQGISWVKYEATNAYPSSSSFKTVKIYYTNAKSSSIKYSFDNGAEKTASLIAGSDVKELVLNNPTEAKSIKITTTMANQAYFFGVSLESGNGIYIDNFPWRGNTGVSFKEIQDNVYEGFKKHLNYKLIILSFGANMLASGVVNYAWYEKQMTDIITLLKSHFPQTSILIIGMGDKSMKRGTRFMTDPNVPKLVELQKNIAQKTGVAFWDKYEAMGGENSMLEWVNSNPPLGTKDYGHLTLQGSKKMGQMVSQTLLDAFYSSK